MTNPPNVLIVYPEAFDLGWCGATARLIDISIMFSKEAWEVRMLSANHWYISKDQRPQERLFMGTVLRTPFTGGYPWLFDQNRDLRRIFRIYWKIRGKEYYRKILSLGWAKQTINWVGKAWSYPNPTLIWSVCTSNINGIVAGRELARYFGCPYIIEFQDPPSGYSADTDSLLKDCIRCSNGVVTTTASYALHLRQSFELKEKKVITLYLSFKENVNETVLPFSDNKVIFLHAGTLFADQMRRSAHDFLYGMKEAIKLRPDIKQKILFRLLAAGPGEAASMQLAKSLRISECVQYVHQVPLDKLAQETRQSNVLLVIKYPQSSFDMQIPGKLFQYLGARKPILGIMNPNCEAANILKQSGLGHIVAPGEINAVARYIIDAVDNTEQFMSKYKSNEEFIKQFELTSMARNGMNFVNDILLQGIKDISGE